jgi:hypothetical protein
MALRALLPEGSFRADAGTDVVVDILFFRKRKEGEPQRDVAWLDLDEIRSPSDDEGAVRINRWFARHPGMVLGTHAHTPVPSARPIRAGLTPTKISTQP